MQYIIKGISFTRQSNRLPITLAFAYNFQNLSPSIGYTHDSTRLTWGRFRVGLTWSCTYASRIEHNGFIALQLLGYDTTHPICTGKSNLVPTLNRSLTVQDNVVDYNLNWQPPARVQVTWNHKNSEIYGQGSEGYNNYAPVSAVTFDKDIGSTFTYRDFTPWGFTVQPVSVVEMQPYTKAVQWDDVNDEVGEDGLSTFQEGFSIQSETTDLTTIIFNPALFQQHYVADNFNPVASVILVTDRTQADIDAFGGNVPSDYLFTITDKVYTYGETGYQYLSNVNFHGKVLPNQAVLNTLV